MDATLPPKTCSIERLVTREDDVQRVLRGEKTAVRRNGRYADPGEKMNLHGRTFVVSNVFLQTFGDMTDEDARKEGYIDRKGYLDYLQTVHPGMTLQPSTKMWVHEFHE